MRTATVLAFALVSACVAEIDDEIDPDDPAWSEATEPSSPAELDDASLDSDDDESESVDDAEDVTEIDGEMMPADDEDDGPETATIAAALKYRNPLGPTCADPGVVRIPGANGPTFWAACTGKGFPLYSSKDLVTWKRKGQIFTAATKPTWANGNWWAPEVHRVGGNVVAYYTAFSPSRNKMCIGAATAKTMAGPFKDLGRPLVCDSKVSLIDANVHRAADGKRYLYYKTDGNALRPQKKTIIYGHELRADGLGFVGKRRALLRNTLAWEGDVVEAPWVIRRGKYYYLFYSGFRYCNATYGVGVARSKSPLGPFTKRSAPILKSNAKWTGPGHNSIVRTNGRAWIVYHAWQGAHDCSDPGTPGRKLMLDPITWKGGWPTVRSGKPSSAAHPAP